MVEGSAMLFATLYFALSQRPNWLYCAMIGYVMSLISLFCICFLPESPKFLIEKNRMKEAKQSLEKIASWNNKRLVFNPTDFSESHNTTGSPIKTNQQDASFQSSKSFEAQNRTQASVLNVVLADGHK